MSEEASKLAGIVDGVILTEKEAKALWMEFSEHMDANRGDMVGYAKKKSWFSVAPEYRDGKAVLIVRTTATAKGPPPVLAPPKPQNKAPQKGKPQAPQKGKAKPAQGAKPQAKPAPKPQAGQKTASKPAQPAKPAAQGGHAPPKKRPG
jgi:hypothetical protein